MTTTRSPKTPKLRTSSKRPSSLQRQQDILNAARILFSEEGYDQLSLRKVASKVGIHLKTLQHYFPTKESMVQPMLEYTNSIYRQTFESLRLSTDDAASHLEKVIDFLLRDEKDKQTAGFFYQFWARAHVDDHANQLMQRMYHYQCQNMANLMEPLNPDMDPTTRKERAAMLVAMIEGMMLLCGHGKVRPPNTKALEKEIIKLSLKLATEPDLLES